MPPKSSTWARYQRSQPGMPRAYQRFARRTASAQRWYARGMPGWLRWYRAQVEDFGGTLRVELRLRRRPHALAAAFVVWR